MKDIDQKFDNLSLTGNGLKSDYSNCEAIKPYIDSLGSISDKNPEKMASIITNICEIYNLTGRYNDAIRGYNDLINYKVNDPALKEGACIGRSLNLASIPVLKNGTFRAAVNKDIELLAGIYRRLGNVYLNRGEFSLANGYLNKADSILVNRDESMERINILAMKTNLYFQMGDYNHAIDICNKVLTKDEAKHDSKELALIYYILGNSYSHFMDYLSAEENFDKALRIYRTLGDRNGEGMVLGGFGAMYHRRSDYLKAIRYYRDSLQIFKEIKDKNNLSTTLMNLGTIFHLRCDYSMAIKYYRACLKMAELMGVKTMIARCLSNLGLVLFCIGEKIMAERLIYRSMKLSKKIGLWIVYGYNHIIMGSLKTQSDEFDEAEKYYLKGLRILRRLNEKREIALAYIQLADSYSQCKKFDKAQQNLSHAFELAKELKSKEITARANSIRGKILGLRGNNKLAYKMLLNSLDYFKEKEEKELLWEIYYDLGRLSQNIGNPYEARKYLILSKGIVEEIHSNIPKDLKKRYLEDHRRRKIYEHLNLLNLSNSFTKDYNEISELKSEEIYSSGIIGKNSKFIDVLKSIKNVARSTATVLILGETGTGKEIIAREIHKLSNRADKPFIAIHCASLSEQLLQSELFGHEKGSFTGAIEKKIGMFELANSGTIFLDEVGEIPLSIQVKLLRFIDKKEFTRVGGNEVVKVDVRIICATNKDLEDEVRHRRFREDLYYRINVYQIKLPPLRERKDDIELLSRYYLKKYCQDLGKDIGGIEYNAMEKLINYSFPGNVRELQNEIERAVILTRGGNLIKDSALSKNIRNGSNSYRCFMDNSTKLTELLEETEQKMIRDALAIAKGNISRASEILGVKRHSLQRKMKRLGIRNGK